MEALKPFNADEAARKVRAGFGTSSPWATGAPKKPYNFRMIDGMEMTTQKMLKGEQPEAISSSKSWNQRRK